MRTFRGSYDIPHVFGQTDRDAMFALGRAHARDRFFQMDVLRQMFSALTLLAGNAFAPAFDHSTNQNDYRWGRLHA